VSDLAACLSRMASDAALRARLASAGQAYVTKTFDWDRAVTRLEALLSAR
jgi:glycosyltransferase involved in cell wall biosynthesis